MQIQHNQKNENKNKKLQKKGEKVTTRLSNGRFGVNF